MGHHTFDADGAAELEDASKRYRRISEEELLWALEPSSETTVADLGSGTGFFTDVIASLSDHVYAVDIQEEMHEFYREKGVPENVDLILSGIEELPFETDELNVALSTMTYHEFASEAALEELRRVIVSDGKLVVFDWAADGPGDAGPPVDERYSIDETTTKLDAAGFDVSFQAIRSETFLVIASPN